MLTLACLRKMHWLWFTLKIHFAVVLGDLWDLLLCKVAEKKLGHIVARNKQQNILLSLPVAGAGVSRV